MLSLISLFCIIASYMYLPYCSACTDGFKEALDYADANINQLSYKNDVNFMGDLNTNLGSSGRLLASTTANKQGRILLHYLHKWKYASVHLHTCSTSHSHTYHMRLMAVLHVTSTICHILSPLHLKAAFRALLRKSQRDHTETPLVNFRPK